MVSDIPQTPPPYQGEPIYYVALKTIRRGPEKLYAKNQEIAIEDYERLEKRMQENCEPKYLEGLEDVAED